MAKAKKKKSKAPATGKPQRCRATSKTSGRQCGQPAIAGGTVCRYHGGAAPQVMAAAKKRLQALLFPALDRLEKNIKNSDGWVGTKAVEQVLRYTDVKAPERAVHHVVIYDPAKFKNLTDEQLDQLAAIAGSLVTDTDSSPRGNPGRNPQTRADED